MLLEAGEGTAEAAPKRARLLQVYNAFHEPVAFLLPASEDGKPWKVVLQTAIGDEAAEVTGGKLEVPARSMIVLG